ncbi:nicotinate-nucleotide adenylyltransferase [Marinospirillum insulare]|uniref:Probable nicotinate-nucleotide adenylyltransferase n=1 Tax=Marinospirillum insulare TaxID=217169 RepID=A0ABQ5ZTT5_9GAMM|nr:nicotinate-nucleotide adenylyltransferase [Marinospirillum insulare]GLR62663.1 putative nicotinate-nucleotide adenylyltransferase [Marinospirillum insulare]
MDKYVAKTAKTPSLVLMFGGTFDPIHHGHLRCALELTQVLPVKKVHLVPCQLPAHRSQPSATAEQRLEMLNLAIAAEPLLYGDDRELLRAGPSWSVDTLASLRQDYGEQQPLAMLLGWDAFLGLPSWSRSERLLELAHIIVLARPGQMHEPAEEVLQLLDKHELQAGESLNASPAGRILRLSLPSSFEVSATYIRRLLANKQSARYLLPEQVLDFIHQQQLYQSKH